MSWLSRNVAYSVIFIVHRISHGTNVVVVSIQSNSSKKKLLFADWLFTTITFVPWDILWAMLMVNICSCELDSRRCKKSPSHFRFGRLSGSSYKPQKPRCSYGQVKDERNIVIEYVQVRKSSRVGKLRLSNMHIPICLLLTGSWRELYYAQRTCFLGDCQTKYRMSAFVVHYGNLCVHL